jgi:hypothetical protein
MLLRISSERRDRALTALQNPERCPAQGRVGRKTNGTTHRSSVLSKSSSTSSKRVKHIFSLELLIWLRSIRVRRAQRRAGANVDDLVAGSNFHANHSFSSCRYIVLPQRL